MIKYKEQKVIEDQDWDNLVEETYGRPYCFQQQGGCQDRGIFHLTVSADDGYNDSTMPDSIPEVINGNKMGVNFKAWLARDPKEWKGEKSDESYIRLFWERNFYPDIDMVANDLCKKGLIEAGDYIINIDW